MRAARGKLQAKRMQVSDGDGRAEICRRFHRAECERVAVDDELRPRPAREHADLARVFLKRAEVRGIFDIYRRDVRPELGAQDVYKRQFRSCPMSVPPRTASTPSSVQGRFIRSSTERVVVPGPMRYTASGSICSTTSAAMAESASRSE